MLYIIGICERCKEPLELRLKYIAIDKSVDITAKLALYHKPKPIGSAPACGGRIKVVSVSEVEDDEVRTILPLELWQALYDDNDMSIRDIAKTFDVEFWKVHYQLVRKARRHNIRLVDTRPVGRPSKIKRMEVQSEEQSIIKAIS